MAEIPQSQASIVETWMSSVDAFFLLKEDEANNGYLPYVFKLGFLTDPTDKNFSPESDSYWSLCSLLQYVTGCRSRALPEGVLDAAREFLKDYNRDDPERKTTQGFSDEEAKLIDDCVFHHKLILIGNKTLQDTCLPKQHWTLKQASKKGGCACCGPDPFDEEEEEQEAAARANALQASSGPFAIPAATSNASSNGGTKSNPSQGYVDGKLGFAFDPTRFS